MNFIKKVIPFKTENLYNLLLYKLKALCDRPDTIKDLFDLYFILRELPGIPIEELIRELNAKFENAISIRYEREDIIKALQHDLKWNIEVGEIKHYYDLKSEIEAFQVQLKDAFEKEPILEFSYQNRIKKRAKMHDMDIETYLEVIDVFEENNFWIDEVKKR